MATRQNLLSPEELSALSEGLKDGTMESDTGFNTGVRVRKHDLASENSSLGVNVSSIDMMNERFKKPGDRYLKLIASGSARKSTRNSRRLPTKTT